MIPQIYKIEELFLCLHVRLSDIYLSNAANRIFQLLPNRVSPKRDSSTRGYNPKYKIEKVSSKVSDVEFISNRINRKDIILKKKKIKEKWTTSILKKIYLKEILHFSRSTFFSSSPYIKSTSTYSFKKVRSRRFYRHEEIFRS